MEIKFLNLSIKEKSKYIVNNFNLKITSSQITGIYQDNWQLILKLLLNKLSYDGEILIDNKNIFEYNDNLISYVLSLNEKTFLTKKVKDEFFLAKKRLNEYEKSYIQKIVASLRLVGLEEDYLEKDIYTLSKSEKKLLQIALALVVNPDILILEDPFVYFDKNSFEKLINMLLELKRKYQKTIIICSQDIDILYQITDNLVIFKDNKVLINDKTKTVFKDLLFLKDNQIELPEIIQFKEEVLFYGIKLQESKSVNDLIKDVYKNVQENKKEVWFFFNDRFK